MKVFFSVVLLLGIYGMSSAQRGERVTDPGKLPGIHTDPVFLHRAVKAVTDVMVHDIFSPPVAAGSICIPRWQPMRCW